MLRRLAPVPFLVAALLGCSSTGIDRISIPEGFEIELVAGPPLIDRPVIMDMDDLGRLYVAESSGSNDAVQKQLVERPHRILRLEDVDGDGRYDRRTVFADRMMFPEGVLWHAGSVYVSAPPSIWKLTDTDDDGVADRREEWFDAKTLTNCANDLHGPYLGLDGWIYWTKGAFAEQTYERPGKEPFVTRAAHVFRRRAEGGPVEAVMTGGMDNPVEVAFTPEGERLVTSTFLLHPQIGKRDGMLHAVYGGVYGKEHGVTDNHPMTGGYLSVMTHMGGSAPVGLARIESDGLGEDYRGRLFATSFNLRKVTSHRLVPNGATFETEDADFLVSESIDFHPTDVMEDADGSLLVIDTGAWYKLCCPSAQLTKPDVLGAIYRIRRKGVVAPDDPLGLLVDWSPSDLGELAPRLSDVRPAVRKKALARLAEQEAVGVLSEVIAADPSADARRNAVWALTRIDGSAAREGVRSALRDDSGSVRHAALNSIALHRDASAMPEAIPLLADDSDAVKRAAAEALGRIGDPAAVEPLLAASALTEGEVLTHSLVYALIEIADPRRTRSGLKAVSGRTRRAAMIALDQMRPAALDSTTVLTGLDSDDPTISETANWIAGRHPEWGGRLAGYLGRMLQQPGARSDDRLAEQLKRFSGSPEVQSLLARSLRATTSPETRLLVLDVMAQAAVDEAPEGWAAAIAYALSRGDSVMAAVEAARRLPRPDSGNPVLDGALLEIARNPGVDPTTRIRALDAGLGEAGELDAALFDLAKDQVLPSVAVDARAAAGRILARASLDDAQLSDLAHLLPSVGPMELPQVVRAFGQSGSPDVGSQFAEALERARGLSNLRADILSDAASAYPEEVQRRLDSVLSGEVEDLAEKAANLETLLGSLGDGDIFRGQAVFNSSETACLSCHTIGYQGGTVGPDLTRIGQLRTRRDLLESIVYPSSSFVRSFEPVVAVTSDESVNGVLVEESDSHIVLAVDADERVRIARSEVEEVRPGTVSIMPSGLEEQLSRDELADLLAFLEATEWGPQARGR